MRVTQGRETPTQVDIWYIVRSNYVLQNTALDIITLFWYTRHPPPSILRHDEAPTVSEHGRGQCRGDTRRLTFYGVTT